MGQIISVNIDSLMERIARDSIVSSEFIEESILIAQEKLFNYLMEDSDRYYNNTVLTDFIRDTIDNSLSDMYVIEKLIASCYIRNEENAPEINEIDRIIDSLLIEIDIAEGGEDYEARVNLINSLNEHIASRISIIYNLDANNESHLAEAEEIIPSLESQGMPDDNKILLYPIIIERIRGNIEDIDDYEETLFYIGNQCPSSGGPVVFIARAILEEKYDTLLYDDRNVCLEEGYFRMLMKNDSTISINSILLIPNPASSSVTIRIVNEEDLINDVEVFNKMGVKVFFKKDITKNLLSLNTSSFSNGVYTVRVKTSNDYYLTTKLIIIK